MKEQLISSRAVKRGDIVNCFNDISDLGMVVDCGGLTARVMFINDGVTLTLDIWLLEIVVAP